LWNAIGTLQHKNNLQIILEKKKINIVLLSETHLTKNSNFKITGYEIIRADHIDGTAHGGAALLISNKIEHNPHPLTQTANIQTESTSIKINSLPLTIVFCYFPPGRIFHTNELSVLTLSQS